MKSIIKFLIISLALLFAFYIIGNTTTVRAEDRVKFYKLGDTLSEQTVKEIIGLYASGKKADQMLKTIYCESGYKNIQSNIVSKGERENSWGLAQINLKWNPQVEKEQALDPHFAIKWMSDNWETTKWYGLNRADNTCNLIYK
jgi:hypothetical protein